MNFWLPYYENCYIPLPLSTQNFKTENLFRFSLWRTLFAFNSLSSSATESRQNCSSGNFNRYTVTTAGDAIFSTFRNTTYTHFNMAATIVWESKGKAWIFAVDSGYTLEICGLKYDTILPTRICSALQRRTFALKLIIYKFSNSGCQYSVTLSLALSPYTDNQFFTFTHSRKHNSLPLTQLTKHTHVYAF